MSKHRFVSALNEVFEARLDGFMKSVEIKNDHVFSERFNKKIRRIIKTRTNPLRLFYIERHVLINTLSIFTMIAVIAAIGVLNLSNIGNHGNGGGTYIDIGSDYSVLDSELAEKLEHANTPLNTVITDYKQDTLRTGTIWRGSTFDDKYCYLYGAEGFWGDEYTDQRLQYYKIDLQSGVVSPICNIPGCTHDINNDPNCITHEWLSCITAVGDAFWSLPPRHALNRGFERQDQIIEIKGDTRTVIFENTYCTEFEELNYKESSNDKYHISCFLVDDNYIYLFGPSYAYRIDRATMKADEPINITDDASIDSVTMYGSKAYFTDSLDELFVIDFETGTSQKLGDMYNVVQVYNDKLYYTRVQIDQQKLDDYMNKPHDRWDHDEDADRDEFIATRTISFYCSDLDGGNEAKLLDDVTGWVIKDSKLFYSQWSGDKGKALRCYDLETKQEKIIYDNWGSCNWVFTADHIDRIFVVSKNESHNSVILSVRSDGSDLWVKELDGKDFIP